MKSKKTLFGKLALTATCSILLGLAVGCSSTSIDMGHATTHTAIQLSGKNYRLLEGGATGTSYGFALLGLIPITSPHYGAAKRDLFDSCREQTLGKAVALSNEMDDKSTVYLILFSVPKITVTADIIEFTDASTSTTAQGAMPATAPVITPVIAAPILLPVAPEK